MSSHAPKPARARVVPLRTVPPVPDTGPAEPREEPLWRHLVGDVLRRERRAQERTLQDVADAARISMPYLSELERGRKEASSEVLAAAARALGLTLAELLSRAQATLAHGSRTSRIPRLHSGLTRQAPARPAPGRTRPAQGEVRLAA